jgi:hypothetical protein
VTDGAWWFSARSQVVGRAANYVIELLAEILGERPETEKSYPWALGDKSEKTGRQVQLPFDAVWEARKLVVEVDEEQHRSAVAFWDKPHRLTVSGVDRGEQRRIYDRRKRTAARSQGYVVVEIEWERRPLPERRNVEADRRRLRVLLRECDVDF